MARWIVVVTFNEDNTSSNYIDASSPELAIRRAIPQARKNYTRNVRHIEAVVNRAKGDSVSY